MEERRSATSKKPYVLDGKASSEVQRAPDGLLELRVEGRRIGRCRGWYAGDAEIDRNALHGDCQVDRRSMCEWLSEFERVAVDD